MQITENNNNTPWNLGSTHYATDVKYDFRAFWKANKDPDFLIWDGTLFQREDAKTTIEPETSSL